jgi:hypothetical protein
VPTFGEYDVLTLAALANEAERVGWDGFFVWDHLFWAPQPGAPLTDTTVALTAIALATGRVRFGALVTALARRRPWKLGRRRQHSTGSRGDGSSSASASAVGATSSRWERRSTSDSEPAFSTRASRC